MSISDICEMGLNDTKIRHPHNVDTTAVATSVPPRCSHTSIYVRFLQVKLSDHK